MGDRAIIILTARTVHDTDEKGSTTSWEASPAIYLHWRGSEVPGILHEWEKFMGDRLYDMPYSAARLVGIIHKASESQTGMGIWNLPHDVMVALKAIDLCPAGTPPPYDARGVLQKFSHGDAGVVVYSIDRKAWTAYAGYLERGAQP